jgi:hypothetical protein
MRLWPEVLTCKYYAARTHSHTQTHARTHTHAHTHTPVASDPCESPQTHEGLTAQRRHHKRPVHTPQKSKSIDIACCFTQPLTCGKLRVICIYIIYICTIHDRISSGFPAKLPFIHRRYMVLANFRSAASMHFSHPDPPFHISMNKRVLNVVRASS